MDSRSEKDCTRSDREAVKERLSGFFRIAEDFSREPSHAIWREKRGKTLLFPYASPDDPFWGRYSWILFGLTTWGQVDRNRVLRWGACFRSRWFSFSHSLASDLSTIPSPMFFKSVRMPRERGYYGFRGGMFLKRSADQEIPERPKRSSEVLETRRESPHCRAHRIVSGRLTGAMPRSGSSETLRKVR